MVEEWLERRLNTAFDDVPISQSSHDALNRVLSVLSKRLEKIPEPDILYSSDGERIEISWQTVGLFIRPEYVVVFRPKLHEYKFLHNVDDEKLALIFQNLIK